MSDIFEGRRDQLIEQYPAHVRSGKEYPIPLPASGSGRFNRLPDAMLFCWSVCETTLVDRADIRSPFVADVFVSYVSEDRTIAEKISRGLESAGFSVWWDRHIRGGVGFRKEIDRQLGAAKVVVVLWSAASRDSEWVCDEAQQALDEKKLLPVRLDGVQPPLGFRQAQSLDFSGWNGDPTVGAFPALVDSARDFAGRPQTDAPPAVHPSAAPQRGRWRGATMIVGGVVVIALALAYVGVDKFWPSPAQTERDGAVPRTAVFKFAVPNGDANAADFAEAIENEVVETMDATGMPVIARSAIESLSGTERVARSVQLGAEYALDGDIRREGEKLQVSARIESLRSSTTLWANSYQGADADRLRMQIATQLTDTLRCVSPDPTPSGMGPFKVRRDDVDSLKMLLRGCSTMRVSGENRELFRSLVKRYPDSAALNAALAMSIVTSLVYGSVPPTANAALISEARAAADRAMSLDAQQGDAYVALYLARAAEGASPYLSPNVRRDVATTTELEALLVEGLRHAPEHANLNSYYGQFLQNGGRMADSEPYLRRASTGDPLSAAKPLQLALTLDAIGRPADSEKVLRDAAARRPDDRSIWQVRLHLAVFSNVGDLNALISSTPTSVNASDAASCWRALAAAKSTSDADAERRAASAAISQCLDHRLIDKYEAIGIAAALGDVDGAFARAEQIGTWRELVWQDWQPLLKSEGLTMQRDARFMPLMRRLGFLDIWKQSDHWPDFCRLPDLPYDCHAENASVKDG